MKIFKHIIISVLIAAAGFSLCSCRIFEAYGRNLKDVVLDAMDNAMQSFSKRVLTRKFRLTGDKEEGKSAYEGKYAASYSDFSGKEILFGSTALNLDKDISLLLEYDLNGSSGEGCLYRVAPNGISIITKEGSGTVRIEIEPGDNYVIFQGDHFSGELTLECSIAE